LIVSVSVDDGAWKRGWNELLGLLLEAGRDASLRGAQEIQDLTRAKLEAQHHSEFTYSPSPIGAGMPPAAVSGALGASISAQMVTMDQAWVGPTDLPYARIQELGGEMHGRPMMHYQKYGQDGIEWISRSFVELTPRPYLEPATEDIVDSGRLTEIYIEHWTYAIEGD
jgi:phage gpG-like protein